MNLKYYIVFLLLVLGLGIAQAQVIIITGTVITDVTCNGGTDGKIVVTTANSSPGATITYSVLGTTTKSFDTTATSYTFENLAAGGAYVVVVQDLSNNSSASVSGIVVSSPKGATFKYSVSGLYCKDAANPTPTFPTTPYPGNVAGAFSSTGGLVFVSTATGQVNLSASTAGTYVITNTIAATGACPAVTATKTITITTVPIATITYAGTPYCSNVANPTPTLGVGASLGAFTASSGSVGFVSTSTGEVDMTATSAGNYTITNTIAAAGGCPLVASSTTFDVVAAAVGTFSYTGTPYCSNASNPLPTLVGSGGTFSAGLGITFVSTGTGQINLAASTPGSYTITNTLPASAPCAAIVSTAPITITSFPSTTFTYASASYCKSGTDPTPTVSGAAGGTFSSSGGLVINSVTGKITLNSSNVGTYKVTYSIAASGGCALAASTFDVTITAAPVATFSYAGTPYCSTGANPSPTLVGTAGAFTSTGGLVFINAATGQVDLTNSTAGTYTVTNTIAATGGCPAIVATSSITIPVSYTHLTLPTNREV